MRVGNREFTVGDCEPTQVRMRPRKEWSSAFEESSCFLPIQERGLPCKMCLISLSVKVYRTKRRQNTPTGLLCALFAY